MSALSTKHVVLGLVIERRGYGYDLQRRFNTRFRFLSLSEKVTYRALDALEEEGWIESVGEKQQGRTERGAPRVIYDATESGREEFSRWIAEPCEIGIAREMVHVKLVLSQPPDWPRVVQLTESLEKQCLTAMREIQTGGVLSFDQLADPEIPWDAVASMLVDDAECARLEAMIGWLQRVRVLVRRRMEPPVRRMGHRT